MQFLLQTSENHVPIIVILIIFLLKTVIIANIALYPVKSAFQIFNLSRDPHFWTFPRSTCWMWKNSTLPSWCHIRTKSI